MGNYGREVGDEGSFRGVWKRVENRIQNLDYRL
jgi:hypothetical protein